MAILARPINPYIDIIPQLAKFRGLITTNLTGPIGQFERAQVASNIIEDIVTLLFLIESGNVREGSGTLSTKDFFSRRLSGGTSIIVDIHSMIRSLHADTSKNLGLGATTFSTKHMYAQMFHGTILEPGVLEALDEIPIWRDFLECLSGFRWVLSERDAKIADATPTITPVIFSRIHELDMPAESSAGVKKRTGVYYTPASISRYICNRCLAQHITAMTGIECEELDHLVDRLDTSKLEEILKSLRRVRVLDPSCGSGEFLVAMADCLFSLRMYIVSKLPSESIHGVRALKFGILCDNIFGAELSIDAINIAKKRLWLWMLSGDDDDSSENRSFPSLEENIVNGNALIGWLDEKIHDVTAVPSQDLNDFPSTSDATARLSRLLEASLPENAKKKVDLEPYRPLHWRLVFREVFENDRGFDIVVGNPPYVFVRGQNFDEIEQGYFSNWYFQGYSTITKGKARQSGKINAFSLFIARSINLLKEGGILGFIVPNTLLRTTTNDVTRQFITTSAFVHEIVDLQDGVFDGVVASTIVLILEKGNPRKYRKRTVVKHDVEDLLSGKYQSHEVDQERFPLNPACIFDIHVDDRYAAMFTTMQEDTFPLEDACSEIIEGLVTRRGDNMFTTDPNIPNAKKLLRGKDIDRYKIEWHPGQYIIFDPTKLHRARPVGVHEAPVKLLAQRIGGGTYPLRVAYDDHQHYFFASINAIILKKEMNDANIEQEYKYILAILNSTLMNAYYLLNFSNKSALTVNVSKTFLETLPIKIATPAKRRFIALIVDYLLFLNALGNGETELLTHFDKELLDLVIFDLYTCQEQKEEIFGKMLSFLNKIDPWDSDRPGTMAIIKDSMARMKADRECMSWLRSAQESAGFKAIKKLFEERVDGIVD